MKKKVLRRWVWIVIIVIILLSGWFILTSQQPLVSAPQKEINKECLIDSDCAWTITNCCSETGGAYWECINSEKSTIICQSENICLAVLRPKPTDACLCINNQCQKVG